MMPIAICVCLLLVLEVALNFADIKKSTFPISGARPIRRKLILALTTGGLLQWAVACMLFPVSGAVAISLEQLQPSTHRPDVLAQLVSRAQRSIGHESTGTLADTSSALVLKSRNAANLAEVLRSDTTFNWVAGQWASNARNSYDYDAQSLLTTEVHDTCANSTWSHRHRHLTTYDAGNRPESLTMQSLPEWTNYQLVTYRYNTAGDVVEEMEKTWTSDWHNSYRYTYSYSNGNLFRAAYYYWAWGQWIFDYGATYTWDTAGRLTSILAEGGFGTLRVTFTYDLVGDQTQMLQQMWQADSAKWTNTRKNDYGYDATHNKTLDITSTWSGTTWTELRRDSMKYVDERLSQLVIVSQGVLTKTDNAYDTNGRLITKTSQSSANGGGTWTSTDRTVSVYGPNSVACCIGTTGNIDGDPGDITDIADLMALVDYLFFTGPLSSCSLENDIDQDDTVDIADLMALVDFLFFEASLPNCP